MSIYALPPSPSLAIPEIPFATWTGGFTDFEISRIINIGDLLESGPGITGSQCNVDKEIRHSSTSWLKLDHDTHFVYERLGYIARQLNGQYFDYDIWGFGEDLQYTVYRGDHGHYTWHQDCGLSTEYPRKLSMVLQLSDPSEYEGGDLEILSGVDPIKITKEKGLVTVFPSFMLHRVTPVTKGVRKTLVVWLVGPRFR